MRTPGALTVAARGEREIVMTRPFAAPPRLVFDAFTKPLLVKRWLYGPEGWSLAVCEIDLRVGGAYRYLWRHPDGNEMGAQGVYREVAPPGRLVHTETFDPPWYPGEAMITSVFAEHGSGTLYTATLRYMSKEARDMVLQSPMEQGVAQSYDRLAAELMRDPALAENPGLHVENGA